LTQLHATFEKSHFKMALGYTETWLPWGKQFRDKIERDKISVPSTQKGAQFLLFNSEGPVCQERSLAQFSETKFRKARERESLVGFSFTLNPDEVDHHRTFNVSVFALEAPMSMMLLVPDPNPGVIDSSLADASPQGSNDSTTTAPAFS
jgi:hypothetical protein